MDFDFWSLLKYVLALWILTPGLFILIGLLYESRLVPLDPKRSYLAFFPGDLILGVGVGGFYYLSQPARLAETAWYNAWWLHLALIVITMTAAYVLHRREAGAYPKRALNSPTKIYHDFVLFGGYGYLAISSVLQTFFGSFSWWTLFYLVFILVWVGLGVLDNMSPNLKDKARLAHTANWKSLWSNDWRLTTY